MCRYVGCLAFKDCILIHSLSHRRLGSVGAVPTIHTILLIYDIGSRQVITSCNREAQPLQQVFLFVLYPCTIGIGGLVLTPKDNLHEIGILYLFVLLVIVQGERELIRPRLLENIHFPDDHLIVITVMEALEPLSILGINPLGQI